MKGDPAITADQPRRGTIALGALSGVVAALVMILVLALLRFWPLLAGYYRGAPRGTARLANAAGLLVAYVIFAVVVVAHRLLVRPPVTAGTGPAVARRRVLVAGGAGLGLAVASGGVLQRPYKRSTFSYDGLQYNGDIQPITPNDRFYVVTQNIVDPINRLPSIVQESTLACISNGVGGGLMSNARWKGVPRRRLLEDAGPKKGVRDAVLHGVDGYTVTFPLDKAMDPTTLVAHEMNGEPLPQRHGFPVRIIVPGLYGEKNVKWIDRINLLSTNEQGFYENQRWGPDFVVQTQSRFSAQSFDKPLSLASMLGKGERQVVMDRTSGPEGATSLHRVMARVA